MLSINPDQQSERDNYKLLTGSIIPRPVAFVTTLSGAGILNAAPFSYFNIVTADPPMVSVSVQRKQGHPKDTARNAADQGAFVVHIADESYIRQINETAAALPPEESEVTLAGLTPVPSESIPVPGVAEAKVRMECVLERAIPLGGTAEAPAADLLIGRVVRFHIDESLYEDGRINAAELGAVSRLAGNDYAKVGSRFSIPRPE
ncbi:flavin reductase (DIM6/NTAB) family NADH-FMN oxidoreductase RutF [Fontibacillus phaseoli]|uniref:Flavin reductase (DIM6/NTAB) family NADH-FMN oxidoreductase RutF n=1 Tax=Fontibacillus phaseoli TaxID=1416533 RepID=A0A369B884_9BACL|nr:flavin reductase family protein [Fontibacillus phaseoli]RCX16757.1 flavin reductase (DIM6/NTAB) family NADH-FMN oxidoreductase RutF [Fontibacillus phaseoli]